MDKQEQTNPAQSQKKRFFFLKNRKSPWVITGVCVSLITAIIFTCFYPFFEKEANMIYSSNNIESVNNIEYLYQNCFILYRDLYNRLNSSNKGYEELYLQPAEGFVAAQNEEVVEIFYSLQDFFERIENDFFKLNALYDYVIEDTRTGVYISNLPTNSIDFNEQSFYVSFLFDENGNVSVGADIQGNDVTKIRKNANQVIRDTRDTIDNFLQDNFSYTEYQKHPEAQLPMNCKVTFCMQHAEGDEAFPAEYDYLFSDFDKAYAYQMSHCGVVYLLLLFAVALLGFFVPERLVAKPWNTHKICRPAIEILFLFGCIVSAFGNFAIDLASQVQGGDLISHIASVLPQKTLAIMIAYGINLLGLALLYFGGWYIGICVREIRENGFKAYFKKRCAFYQIFPYCRKKFEKIYDMVSHFDLTQDAKKTLLKVVLINAVIVFLISSFWVGGFMIAVVYSVVLYIILRKYISDLQKKYRVLLEAINQIAEGNLNVTISEDLGVFEPFRPQLVRIQSGFKKAVDEEVKSQRMKSELITNVSHDLKTPLTAIITYVNLLKEQDITEEQRKEYLDTLEKKSMRLKVLIEDLFDVSKANSGNATLNYMDVDIINLLKQVELEMTDKLKNANLDIRMNLPEQKVIISLDSQKTYRIYENLFVNISKYALQGTRVYVSAVLKEDSIEITLKNIAAEEICVEPEELTERFVRGDVSRNTEGSGLGLAIARSFTELQGGSFSIQVDGDLFKVTTIWKL